MGVSVQQGLDDVRIKRGTVPGGTRILVVDDNRQVTDYLYWRYTWDNDPTKYLETVWTGPDRIMRDMMADHNLTAADPSIQQTLDAWSRA